MSKLKIKHYNSKLARKIYFEANDIKQTAGTGKYAKWFCQNPDCKAIHKLSDLEIHHLIPRSVAPSLTYVASNMVLLCQQCHRNIEQNQERKNKTKYRYRQVTFCHHCGTIIEFKRDRIGSCYFHPECMINFIQSPNFISFIKKIQEEYKIKN